MSESIDLDDLQRVGVKVREKTDDNWLADMVELAAAEIARLREERRSITTLLQKVESLEVESKRLRESLAIFVHAHATGNSLPPHIEQQAKSLLPPGPEANG